MTGFSPLMLIQVILKYGGEVEVVAQHSSA
jgi:hypothetical protein